VTPLLTPSLQAGFLESKFIERNPVDDIVALQALLISEISGMNLIFDQSCVNQWINQSSSIEKIFYLHSNFNM